ncbi:MAG: VWA domain-containing protein [Planctomycetes bacterium]|nr:VWA domain-containing protein [Planctomycetota bacterium]
MVDASASVRRTRPTWELDTARLLSESAGRATEEGSQLLVAGYSREVLRWFGPASAAEFAFDPNWLHGLERGEDATDLAAALEALGAWTRGLERSEVSLSIIGDGTFTGVDPSPAASAWAREAAVFELAQWPAGSVLDLALAGLDAPDELEQGAPLAVLVHVQASAIAVDTLSARVLLDVDSDSESRRFERELALQGTEGSVRFDVGALASGLTTLRARVRLAGDPLPENDGAQRFVRARGAAVVGWCASSAVRESVRAALASWPRDAGLSWTEFEPTTLAVSLGACDALVTVDLDPDVLPGDALLDFVRAGGSWLACGGESLLPAFERRARGGASSSLPLELDDEDDEQRDVVLLVDASGSMSGEPLAALRTAALALIGASRARDELRLHFFTDHLDAALDLGRGASARGERDAVARRLLAARAPSGPTDIPRVLEELALEVERRGRPALVFLLTDGRDQSADDATERRIELALQRVSAGRARLRTIPIGSAIDTAFLARLERPQWGARVEERSADPTRALVREVTRGRMREGDIEPQVRLDAQPVAWTWPAELARALAAGGGVPELRRSLRMRARDGDALALTDDEGRALLGLRTLGHGRTATLATMPWSDWAPRWTAEPARWMALIRALASAGAQRRATLPIPTWELPGALELRDVPPQWPLDARARVRSLGAGQWLDAEVEIVAHPAFEWGALRRVRWPDAALDLDSALELRLEAASGELLGAFAAAASQREEFRRPARRVALATDASGSASPGRGPRASALGWSALFAGLAALALGGLLGAVSNRARL